MEECDACRPSGNFLGYQQIQLARTDHDGRRGDSPPLQSAEGRGRTDLALRGQENRSRGRLRAGCGRTEHPPLSELNRRDSRLGRDKSLHAGEDGAGEASSTAIPPALSRFPALYFWTSWSS